MRKERDSLIHLLGDRAVTVAIGWVECLVIAERTAAPSYLSITVRTSETGINGNLLHLAAKDATQVTAEFVI